MNGCEDKGSIYMIGTELLKGQGLGNQLFCYVTTRCIAMNQGRDFSILGSETLANNIHSSCGLYFMDLDFGVKAGKEDFTGRRCPHGHRKQRTDPGDESAACFRNGHQ